MPIESELVNDIPNAVLGKYLTVNFDENSVHGYYRIISKKSDRRYLVQSQIITFIDSAYCAQHGLSPITEVTLHDDHLEIITANRTYERGFADTLSSDPKRGECVIDLNENRYYDSFADLEGSKVSPSDPGQRCQLRLQNNRYYLNVEYFDKYWFISRFSMDGENLRFDDLSFTIESEEEPIFEQLKNQYKLKRFKPDSFNKSNTSYFIAQANDVRLERLLNEELFNRNTQVNTWHRVSYDTTNQSYLVIGFLILVGVILILRLTFKLRQLR